MKSKEPDWARARLPVSQLPLGPGGRFTFREAIKLSQDCVMNGKKERGSRSTRAAHRIPPNKC